MVERMRLVNEVKLQTVVCRLEIQALKCLVGALTERLFPVESCYPCELKCAGWSPTWQKKKFDFRTVTQPSVRTNFYLNSVIAAMPPGRSVLDRAHID